MSMQIESILLELGIHSFSSYTEVLEGADSSVWKISLSDGSAFALRILSSARIEQFRREERMIDLAIEAGIPVPKILSVSIYGESAVMLMEWGKGRPVLEELMEHPDNAKRIGSHFGKVQAAINQVHVPESLVEVPNWLTAQTIEEQEIITTINSKYNDKYNKLVHLDYHPLNVLIDDEKITAVIDWANATAGDPCYDLARTFSILQLEGTRPGSALEQFDEAIKDFEQGWIEGYQEVSGTVELIAQINVWAGLRMERDLAGKRDETEFIRIRNWMNQWIKE
jgi:aminoglycoside phosphotransferase (APT) family kinase protein